MFYLLLSVEKVPALGLSQVRGLPPLVYVLLCLVRKKFLDYRTFPNKSIVKVEIKLKREREK
jgi:hypothetical protein